MAHVEPPGLELASTHWSAYAARASDDHGACLAGARLDAGLLRGVAPAVRALEPPALARE